MIQRRARGSNTAREHHTNRWWPRRRRQYPRRCERRSNRRTSTRETNAQGQEAQGNNKYVYQICRRRGTRPRANVCATKSDKGKSKKCKTMIGGGGQEGSGSTAKAAGMRMVKKLADHRNTAAMVAALVLMMAKKWPIQLSSISITGLLSIYLTAQSTPQRLAMTSSPATPKRETSDYTPPRRTKRLRQTATIGDDKFLCFGSPVRYLFAYETTGVRWILPHGDRKSPTPEIRRSNLIKTRWVSVVQGGKKRHKIPGGVTLHPSGR